MAWNPDQYLKFAQPRLRPALDLLAQVHHDAPRRVYDLGCGTGNITRLLAQRWPGAEVTGVDDSAEMLAKAAADGGRIHWQQQGLADWEPTAPADVIYSNAALHWLPDHDRLLPALAGALAPSGVLAIQMPDNFGAPSHTEIEATVMAGPWREQLAPLVVPSPVASPAHYYGLLAPLASQLSIWETEYLQVLEGADPVKEWTKGTWLMRYLGRLQEPQRSQFEQDYAQRVRAAYPPQPDGKTLFPFRRLFIVMTRRA